MIEMTAQLGRVSTADIVTTLGTPKTNAHRLFSNLNHPLLEKAEVHLITRVDRKLSVASNKMLQMMTSQMRAFR